MKDEVMWHYMTVTQLWSTLQLCILKWFNLNFINLKNETENYLHLGDRNTSFSLNPLPPNKAVLVFVLFGIFMSNRHILPLKDKTGNYSEVVTCIWSTYLHPYILTSALMFHFTLFVSLFFCAFFIGGH